MDSFVFALNATIPVFLVMVVGWFLQKLGLMPKAFTDAADKFVFKVALPVSLFLDIAGMDIHTDFDWTFVLFCALFTAFMFSATWALARAFWKDKSIVGAFSQGACRSSAAILGIVFAQNIFGSTGMTPLMILAAVPLFNIFAVIILTFSASDSTGGQGQIKKACIGILKNPIIIGIVAGVPFSILQIQLPEILHKAASSIGGTASPLALLVIGATFEGRKALAKLKPTVVATAIKLLVLPAVALPLGIALGFGASQLVAILIMTGSPTTVTSYIMAKNMKNDATLSASIVVLTTLLSAVTLTMWVFLLRSGGYI